MNVGGSNTAFLTPLHLGAWVLSLLSPLSPPPPARELLPSFVIAPVPPWGAWRVKSG